MDRPGVVVQEKFHIVHEAEEGGGEFRGDTALRPRRCEDRFIPDTVSINRFLAFSAVPSYRRGSMACLRSVLCEETQLGESGHAESLPTARTGRGGSRCRNIRPSSRRGKAASTWT